MNVRKVSTNDERTVQDKECSREEVTGEDRELDVMREDRMTWSKLCCGWCNTGYKRRMVH